jgi:hypothetical protein
MVDDTHRYARGVLSIQVPRWYLGAAKQIRTALGACQLPQQPRNDKVRRVICESAVS